MDDTLEVEEKLLKSVLVNPLNTEKGLLCSFNEDDIKDSNYQIVTDPTPNDIQNKPDLTPLYKAIETVGKST